MSANMDWTNLPSTAFTAISGLLWQSNPIPQKEILIDWSNLSGPAFNAISGLTAVVGSYTAGRTYRNTKSIESANNRAALVGAVIGVAAGLITGLPPVPTAILAVGGFTACKAVIGPITALVLAKDPQRSLAKIALLCGAAVLAFEHVLKSQELRIN